MIFQQILKNDVCFKLALFHNIFYFFIIWKLLLKTFISVSRIFYNEDDIFNFSRNVPKSSDSEILFFKTDQIYYEISTIYECVEK